MIRVYARASEEVFVSGQGCTLRTSTGREVLDFLSGIAVSALGHAHPALVEAVRDQIGKVAHLSNLFRHPYTEQVAERLARLCGLEACFFTNSGTEAVEAAIKLTRKQQRRLGRPDRHGLVALESAFHGRSCGAVSLTHARKYRDPFQPLLPDVVHVPRDDVDALARAMRSGRVGALFLEPVQGEGGIYPLADAFLHTARELCDETGAVLVHDEVQCGFGRTGDFLAGDHAGVRPDVVVLAKPIAAGLPMGAMVASAALADVLAPGEHGSTFAGGPLVCRAALVVLEQLEGGLLHQVRARGGRLGQGLAALQHRHPGLVLEVRGRGLMRGLRLAHGAPDLVADLHRRGLLVNCTAGDVIRLLPPFVVTDAEVDRAVDILSAALAAVPQPAK